MPITVMENKSKAPKKGKWARFADKVAKEACLNGMSEDFLSKTKEFRKNFAFRVPFDQNDHN